MKAMTRWLTVAAIGSVAAVQMALAEGDQVRRNNGNAYGATTRTRVSKVLAACEAVRTGAPAGECARLRTRDRVQSPVCERDGICARYGEAVGAREQKRIQRRNRAMKSK